MSSVRRQLPNRGHGRPLLGAAIGAVLSIGPFACGGSSADLSAAGGPCNVVTDCQDGLICCNNGSAGNKATLVCATSVSCLQPGGTGPGPDAGNPATGQGDDAAPAKGDAKTGDDGTVATAPDTGASMDSEAPRDTGPPPMEAGKPPDDAGREAAPPPVDSGGGAPDGAVGD